MTVSLLQPTITDLMDSFLDITDPQFPVEIKSDSRGVLWVNVGPVCVLRICRVKEFTVALNHAG